MTNVVAVTVVGTFGGDFTTTRYSVIEGVPTETNTAMELSGAQTILFNAMQAYLGPRVDPMASATALDGVVVAKLASMSMPKSVAVVGWLNAVMADYYTRKAALSTDMQSVSLDFSNHGELPVALSDMYAEVAALMPSS
jgi:hypothetical protein